MAPWFRVPSHPASVAARWLDRIPARRHAAPGSGGDAHQQRAHDMCRMSAVQLGPRGHTGWQFVQSMHALGRLLDAMQPTSWLAGWRMHQACQIVLLGGDCAW
eukprot:jgi/Ulvmu1/1379/UM011_0107.1